MSWNTVFEHVYIVIVAGFISVIVGVPLGIAAYLSKKARPFILKIADVFQTVPALALLGIIMVFAGAGRVTVIIGITLYSLLPIVRNTCVGLQTVDSGVKEAAEGMGMSRSGRLFKVELPIAFPTIFTGIKIAVINAIGTAVFAAFVGGGGLGAVLNQGIRVQNLRLILLGTLVLMAVAVVMDLVMSAIERSAASRKKGSGKLAAAFALVLLIAAIPLGASSAVSEGLILYDGDYSETQIMHHMAKMLIEDRTDLKVTIKDQMSQVNNFKALINDRIDCDFMISYDGTLLTTFLHLDTSDIPEGQSLYDFANGRGREEFKVTLLGKLGFDNTYAIAVPEPVAQKYGLEKVSDLVPVAGELVFGAEHEFFTQEGSMKYGPFTAFYGLEFKDSVSVDVSLKYTAVAAGSFDVTEVYATDGLNRKAGLKVLEDDLSFFPEYNGAFLIRLDVAEKYPQIAETLSLLDGQIANDDMVEMTYKVDVLGETVDDVAREFLIERGLLKD